MIGECWILSSPNSAKPIAVEYPTIPYCRPSSVSINISSPCLSWLFKFNDLTFASKDELEPLDVTLMDVVAEVYPIPELITTTSSTFWLTTTALNFAPVPDPIPTTSKSGGEVYSLPVFVTCTLIILPPSIIGLNSAPFPVFTKISGFLWKLIIVEP